MVLFSKQNFYCVLCMDFLIDIPFRFYFFVSSTREKNTIWIYAVQHVLCVLYVITTGMFFLQILKHILK